MANQLKRAVVHAILTLQGLGWSQRQIAKKLGIDRETVARYVHSPPAGSKPATNPEPATHGFSVHCVKIATPVSTKTCDTEEGEWTPQWTPEIQSRGVTDPSPDLAEIVTVWPQMPDHIKAAVLALVRTGGVKGGG